MDEGEKPKLKEVVLTAAFNIADAAKLDLEQKGIILRAAARIGEVAQMAKDAAEKKAFKDKQFAESREGRKKRKDEITAKLAA